MYFTVLYIILHFCLLKLHFTATVLPYTVTVGTMCSAVDKEEKVLLVGGLHCFAGFNHICCVG